MTRTIAELAEICSKHPLGEKLLFVPSHTVGHQIGEWLAKSGTPWVNLRATTVKSFAVDVASLEQSKSGLRLVDSDERLAIVEDLCRSINLATSGTGYFGKAPEVPGLVNALSNTLHELRMAGLSSGMVTASSLLVPEKGDALKHLLAAYEQVLEEKKLLDHAGLLSLALELIEGRRRPDRVVMVLSDFPVTAQERRLIHSAGGDSLIIVGHDVPAGTDQPSRFFSLQKQKEISEQPGADRELLQWILEPEAAPAAIRDGSVSLFHALGESNEIREVFRRILGSGIPLDDVELVVPAPDPYDTFIREITSSLDLPVTFGSGFPVAVTRPGAALILYLKWVREDFSARILREILQEGYLDFEGSDSGGERPSSMVAASLLREAAIGWGRDRYQTRLQALRRSYRERSEKILVAGDEERTERYARKASQVRWLESLVEGIMATVPLPDADGNIVAGDLYVGSSVFLSRFCRTAGELDAAAKSALTEKLSSSNQSSTGSHPLNRLVERLTGIIKETRVGQASPKPGCVHVSHYQSGASSGRSRTFVLGLDQGRFPGAILQDPVLLDEERERLSPELLTSTELVREKIYTMAKLVCSLTGSVTMSYPVRDLRENRELFPSSLFLAAYRLISGERTADYSALEAFLGQPAGFIPGRNATPLNDWEWWFAHQEPRFGSDSVYASYPFLLEGEKAEERRMQPQLTEYDGYVPSAADSLDPRMGRGAVSCTRLERLASCPFGYFLKNILRIEPLEEPEKDPTQWLDALQRGSLLHEVFRRFMEALRGRKERPAFDVHWPFLERLALEVVEEYRADVPPPSDVTFNRELGDLREALRIFLRDEEEHCRNAEPCFFELAFGGDGEVASQGTFSEPVHIALPDGTSFTLRGSIDRVDRCGPHEYEIWDYKTGSAFGYREEEYFKRGTQLQHALYALAAEQLLRQAFDKKAKVVSSGYYFPSLKGEGLRVERSQMRRGDVYPVLEDLFELLGKGLFPSSSTDDPCSLCDYTNVCGGPQVAVMRMQRKLDQDDKLTPYARLKDHG
jgi:RecB family exonuclease